MKKAPPVQRNEVMKTQVLQPRSGPAWAWLAALWALLAWGAPDAAALVPTIDYGDAPAPYPTIANANGARHTIAQGVFLGFRVDAEADGQPNSTATGDDVIPTTADDEDGVQFLTPLIPGQFAAIAVIASVNGRLDAWIDFEPNGSWAEQTDRIFASRQLAPGTNTLVFAVPATAKVGTTYARFRFSLLGDLNPTGAAANGEVEDYQVTIQPQTFDFGDAPAVYRTLLADNGPRHVIVSGFHLGAAIDAESDGQPTATALGDDLTAGAPDDEDGVRFLTALVPGQKAELEVVASATGRLDAWIDFNGDGSFLDTGDRIFTAQLLATGVNLLSFDVPLDLAPRQTYARFRFSQQGGLRPEGPADNGEVEDYLVTVGGQDLDFGDAPDQYPVVLAANGARHQRSELRLGEAIDYEPDGQPSADALKDDAIVAGAPDDEDGVKFLSPLVPGQTAQVEVTVNLECFLDAWVDFNLNGSWAETNEKIFSFESLKPGPNVLTFTVPATAVSRDTFARFRVSTKGGLNFTGAADDGEVEDYRITIENRQLDFGDAPENYPVLLANNGARHVIVPGFYLGKLVDAEPNGQPSGDCLGDDKNPATADDEDGVRFVTPLIPGQTADVEVTASQPGLLNAWVDFNFNGSWADATDQIFTDVAIPAGTTTLTFSVPANSSSRTTAARFRFSSNGKISFDGPASDGEVEDYRIDIADRQLDFGDAPQNYPVLAANNGARHVIVPGYYLGKLVDAEPDGQPSADDLGDDNNPSAADDEDGVRFLTPLIPGQSTAVEVTASAPGVLNAWVDFNINGSWADDLEQIFIDVPIPAGSTTLSFFVPANALPRATHARFRFSSQGKISYDGPAADGEVEDYRVEQGRPRDCDQNCTGTNFWLAFPGNYAPDTNTPPQISLCIIGPPGTPINVRVPGLGFQSPIAAIPGGGVALILLPSQTDLGDANDIVTKKGVLVRAGAPISVQGLNHVRYTTDGFSGIHTDALGTEYLVSSFANVHTGAADLNGTQFAIVATADDTKVTITPRLAVGPHPANAPFDITLNAGETYQLRATEDAPADLTGTLIQSDKPIGAFGSHQCANLPSNNEWFCDYIVEQLLPTKYWGRGFLTAPLATRAGDTFRILASADNTDVKIGGNTVATLNRGEFHQVTLKTGAVIVATAPVSVMQYANSSDFDGVTDADPFMVIVPHVQMFNTDHAVCTAPLDFTAHYVNIIAPNSAIGALTLNGAVVPAAAFTAITGTAFSYAQRPVGVGVHRVSSPSPVGVAIYGWAEYDSYGYPGCLAFGDTTPPTINCPTTNLTVVLGGNIAGTAPCSAVVPDLRTQVTYTDNCGLSPNAFPRQVPEPGTIVGPGVHPIAISITDLQGNTATCVVTLTVVDPSEPVIQCPDNRSVTCTSSNGAVVRYVAVARTQCIQNLPVVCTPASGSVFPVGTSTVTCVASNADKIATCAFNVTVKCAEVKLTVNNGQAVLTWDVGTLEGAPSVTGPWNAEPNARSPYTIPAVAPSRFFRVRIDP